jgi:hypothetical protein
MIVRAMVLGVFVQHHLPAFFSVRVPAAGDSVVECLVGLIGLLLGDLR